MLFALATQCDARMDFSSLLFCCVEVALFCDPSALVLGSLGFGPGELGLPWVGFRHGCVGPMVLDSRCRAL